MHADTAMYKAKEQGGNSYQAYSRSMNATALQRLTLENSLRRALEREEFEVHYQPIVDARSGVPIAAEALVRWRHPDLGLLLPAEFIALAEENGLIVPLGEWVMRTACAQNLAWQRAGLAPIRVVVNLSSRQLTRAVTDTVGRILRETGLESRYLGPRAHRERAGEPPEGRNRHPARPPRHGPAPLGGRLRHRLLVVQLPQALPARHA